MKIREKIQQRIENYITQRQEWIDKQNNYKWTTEELFEGLELYGSYQEKETMFTAKILELEWVLSILEKE